MLPEAPICFPSFRACLECAAGEGLGSRSPAICYNHKTFFGGGGVGAGGGGAALAAPPQRSTSHFLADLFFSWPRGPPFPCAHMLVHSIYSSTFIEILPFRMSGYIGGLTPGSVSEGPGGGQLPAWSIKSDLEHLR